MRARLSRCRDDSSPPGKVAAGAGLCRYYPLPSGPAPTPTASVWSRGRGSFVDPLHLRPDQDLDHATRYPLPGSLAESEARLPQVRPPFRDLVAGEGDEVEGLRGAVRAYGRVVLDPHH